MKFFSKITADHWILHNKAHVEARRLAYSMDRIILSEKNIAAFIRKFTQGIDEINKDNSKCKPLELNIWDDPLHTFKDRWIYITGNFQMSLFEVKSEDQFPS